MDAPADDTVAVLARHKLDVDGFHRMAEAGILREGDRVELIDGEVIDMAPIGNDHAASVDGFMETLVLACHGRAIVRVQNPVRFDSLNEPEPDFAVLRLRADRYRTAHPGPGDVLLLVEVADSSLRYDQTVKLPLYARAGIPEVWIADLGRRALDTYRRPGEGGYAERTTHGAGDRLALSAAPEITVALDLLFG